MSRTIAQLRKNLAALQAHVKNVNDQIHDVQAELAEELNDEFVEMEMEPVTLAELMQYKRLHQFEEAK